MYISGEKVTNTSVESVIVQLIGMKDKGFKERTRTLSDTHDLHTPNKFVTQTAFGLTMQPAGHKPNFQAQIPPRLIISQMGRFIEEVKHSDKYRTAKIYAMSAISKLMFYTEQYDSSVDKMREAIAEAQLANDHATSYRLAGILHDMICSMFRQNKVLQEENEKYRKLLVEARDTCREGYLKYSGKPLNPDSRLVAQDELGLAQNEQIGTYGLQQCIAVIVQHPITKKIALAHISLKTSQTDPLENLFKELGGKTLTDPPYKVRLVGATFEENGANKEFSIRVGFFNLTAVAKALIKRDVDIKSAWVMAPDIPNSFSIDGTRFDDGLREDIPLIGWDRAQRSACLTSELNNNSPAKTVTCFDLTKYHGELPLLIPKHYVKRLRSAILNMDDVGMEAMIREEQPHFSVYHVTRTVAALIELRDEYKSAYAYLCKTLDEAVAALPPEAALMEPAKASLIKKLELCPLHVGVNHEIANQPLVDFIKTKLFKVTGNSLGINTQELEKFEFKEATIDIISKHFGETHQSTAHRAESILGKTG
jgi:hypothetical protein